MLAGERIAIAAGFIDPIEPRPLDKVLVELTSVFAVIRRHWQTREVYVAGGRLDPSVSFAVA